MKILRVVCCLFIAASMSGCKVQITVPEGGRVVSDSGAYICEAGETCIIDVVDLFFNEVFQAEPAEGYTFTAWRRRESSFCGGKDKPCPLTTAPLEGTGLESILETDDVFFLDPVFAKPNKWVGKADVNTAGLGVSTCEVKGKIYAMGLGWPGDPGKVEEYDPATDTWTPKADMPTKRAWATSSAVRGKCYVIGGGVDAGPHLPPAFTAVEVYEPATDSWEALAPLPEARQSAASAVVNGKIYVVGGSGATWPTSTPIASVAIYDPQKDEWSTGPDMSTPRLGLGAAAINGEIYAVGGANMDLGLTSADTLERYNPELKKWTTGASLPETSVFLPASAFGGKLYAFGGRDGVNNVSASTHRYDPETDQWVQRADMPTPRYGSGSSVLNGQIYVVGGRSDVNGLPVAVTEEYTP